MGSIRMACRFVIDLTLPIPPAPGVLEQGIVTVADYMNLVATDAVAALERYGASVVAIDVGPPVAGTHAPSPLIDRRDDNGELLA